MMITMMMVMGVEQRGKTMSDERQATQDNDDEKGPEVNDEDEDNDDEEQEEAIDA